MSAQRDRDRAPPPPPPPPPLLSPRRLLLQTLLLRGAPRRALRHQRPARLLPSAAPYGLARGAAGRAASVAGGCPAGAGETGSALAGRSAGRPRGGWLAGRLTPKTACAAGLGSQGALSGRGAGLRGARGQRSRTGARGCSTNASRPLRLGARRLMSPPPRLSGRAHRRLPPLAAAGAFSTRGRRGGGGPGAGPGPSRHNEDAGPGGSPLGARPDGRSARLGAPRPHQRRPCPLACLLRPLHCLRRLLLLLAAPDGRGAIRLSATGPAAP